MNLIRQKKHNCLTCCLAMVLDTTIESVESFIGYTGLENAHKVEGLKGCRGIHIQECLDFALHLGYILSELEYNPQLGWSESHFCPYPNPETRFKRQLVNRRAIILVNGGVGHAIAWNGEKVFDPNGGHPSLDHYQIKTAYLVTKIG